MSSSSISWPLCLDCDEVFSAFTQEPMSKRNNESRQQTASAGWMQITMRGGLEHSHTSLAFCAQLTESVKRSKEDRLVLLGTRTPTAACCGFVDADGSEMDSQVCRGRSGRLDPAGLYFNRKAEVVGSIVRCQKRIRYCVYGVISKYLPTYLLVLSGQPQA